LNPESKTIAKKSFQRETTLCVGHPPIRQTKCGGSKISQGRQTVREGGGGEGTPALRPFGKKNRGRASTIKKFDREITTSRENYQTSHRTKTGTVSDYYAPL